MRFLKRFLIVLVIFILLVTIISIFLPSNFRLERSVIVDADKEQIFKQVNDLKNWKNWSPWALKDSSVYFIKENYSDPSSGVGATFKWKSENEDLGEGTLSIVESVKNQAIATEIDLGMITPKGSWNFSEKDNGIEVIWSTEIDFGFNPITKFFGLFIEDQIAPDYELGLQRLKTYTENLPKINRVEVKKDTVAASWYLSIRDTVNQMEVNNVHGKMYANINQYMDQMDIAINGSPLVIYHFWSDTLIDIEAGIPVIDSVFVEDERIHLSKIQEGNVVTAIHYGPYDRLPETYFGINEWMRKNKVVVTGPPWEVYITDPASESNPEKWETAIYFPIN